MLTTEQVMQSVSQQQSVPQDSPDREMTAATLVMLLWACSECSADPIVIFSLSVNQPGADDDTPDLKDCRPEAPCQYSEGDCTRHGDDGCDSDLVCGVNNCGALVQGMAGSCCVQLAGPSISSYRGEEEPGEFKTFPVETVPGGWSRWTAWSQTLAGWGRERRRIATAGDGDLLAHLERQILD